jgi:phosphoenolpyruvate-protein kinase (PTS system EI component)
LAGDVDAVPLLVGLGVRELSLAPARIPTIKRVLASMSLAEMQQRAQEALAGKNDA